MPGPWRNIPPPLSLAQPSAKQSLVPLKERFTFFWRGPLSQWHPSRFEIDDIAYSHAEQWMMAEKARLFGDANALARIMKAASPKEQKAIGREVRGFVEEVWNAKVKSIIKIGSRAKFSQNPDLLRQLLQTEGTTLVEASPYDPIYGIGLSANDPRAQSRETWLGLNWLGDVLTETRDEFMLEAQPQARQPSP